MTLKDFQTFLASLGVSSVISSDGTSLTVTSAVVTPPIVVPPIVIPPTAPATGTGYSFGAAYVTVTGGGAEPSPANAVVATAAKGDGVADDTAALQSAADAAAAAGKPLLIPVPTAFYKITNALRIGGSVLGAVGAKLPQIKNVNKSPGGQYGTVGSVLRLAAGMTGWVKGLQLTGPYSPGSDPGTEWDQAISCADVNGLTVKGCILEGMAGDGIGDQFATGAGARNVLVDSNTIRGNWRCGVAMVNLCDRWLIVNNAIDKPKMTQGNTPIDLEPWQAASKITNVEIGYNRIVQNQTGAGDQVGYQEAAPAAVKLSAWFDATPGGSIYVHHNFGAWPNAFLASIPTGAAGIPAGIYFSPVSSTANVQGATPPP